MCTTKRSEGCRVACVVRVCVCARVRTCTALQRRDQKLMRMVELSQSRLVRLVFNYNVLEAVSIAVATSILLAGMVRHAQASHPCAHTPTQATAVSVLASHRAPVVKCAHPHCAPPFSCQLSPHRGLSRVCVQVFSSDALEHGSFGYWLLIVFVGTTISLSFAAMLGLIVFESFRAFKFASLYDDIRSERCFFASSPALWSAPAA